MGSEVADFLASLGPADALVTLESQFADPLDPNHQSSVAGLRAGAILIAVASFEEFATLRLAGQVLRFKTKSPQLDWSALPRQMRQVLVFETLKRHPFPKKASKNEMSSIEKLESLVSICAPGPYLIDADVFRPARPNPNPDVIEDIFKQFGIGRVFGSIGPTLARHWPTPLSGDLARDKLDEIVKLRHKFAHNSTALTVGRKEVSEGVEFLKALAATLYEVLDSHLTRLGV